MPFIARRTTRRNVYLRLGDGTDQLAPVPDYGKAFATAVSDPVGTYQLFRFGLFSGAEARAAAGNELLMWGAGGIGLITLLFALGGGR